MPDVERGTESGKDYVLDEADIAQGDVQIVDIEGYTIRHLAYVSIFVLRIYMKFLQEAYPSRLQAMHVINCPSYLDRLISMMSPFLREEVRNMVTENTLYFICISYCNLFTDQVPYRGTGKPL